MANSYFKTLTSNDRVSTRTLLHENIPITGTLFSGSTYNLDSNARGVNIKTFSHGMFQSVYDYPFASSSANHIFDITAGCSSTNSSVSSSIRGANGQQSKKVNIYNQMAQVLNGYDVSGSVLLFDVDGNRDAGAKIHNPMFLNFSRLLSKDEIKKGSFSMQVATANAFSEAAAGYAAYSTITDSGSANVYKVNSAAGEYGVLYGSAEEKVGLIFYQAGIVVLNMGSGSSSDALTNTIFDFDSTQFGSSTTLNHVFSSSSIDVLADGLRNRIGKVSFNNTTEVNSSIFFCRASHNEFNYSSNPTYLSGSEIVIKNGIATNIPFSYVTTVGLYSPSNELVAVAKLSEPLRKDETNELTLRVRLDY
jgi:hypothetical protein